MVTSPNQSRQVRRKLKRIEQKTQAVQIKFESRVAIKIKNLLRAVFPKDKLNKIAIKTNLLQRKRELDPLAILSVLMIGCSDCSSDVPVASLGIMVSFLRKWFDVNISIPALQNKINRLETVQFIKEVMQFVMKYEVEKVLSKLKKKQKFKISFFSRILLQDSTVISLPETLSRIFRGCGGSASPAAVKWDFIVDQLNNLVIRVKFVAGKVPDSSLLGDVLKYISKGDLIIRDLGYFNLGHFSQIVAKNAFFISRLSKAPHVYLKEDDEQPVNLIEHLEKLDIKKKGVDIDIYIGKTSRLPLRLIAVKVPPEVIEKRRQQYKISNGARAEPSESLNEWNGYTLMITNVPREQVSLGVILKLYKIRWQIELFFKNMKSNLAVDKISGENKYRILGLIYIKLTTTWILGLLFAYAQAIAESDREVSLIKFTRWLKQVVNFTELIAKRDFSILIQELERDLDLLYKQKRKKKTTLRDIEDTFIEEMNKLKAA
ncbi:MAG: IS4 family transposase [Parachlamydiaceae bacterium]|nr:IS4 family transposase [Parachlamydiaceae bacterium]